MMKRRVRHIKHYAVALAGITAIFFCACIWMWLHGSNEAGRLRRLADAPARMTWVRQAKSGTEDVFAEGDRFQLMGLDTEDRLGVRVILHGIENYNKPMITPGGNRIVFSNIPAGTIYVVNWDGTGLQELNSGRAVEVWVDPETGVEWVYRIPGRSLDVTASKIHLTRFPLDNPAVEERVWEHTQLDANNIQFSQDGAFMCGLFPWPQAGLLDVRRGEKYILGKGCWPSIAPDNSYLMWIFDGPHRNLIFHTKDNGRKWSVDISRAPGVDGYEVYHPRWSNHDRFMCMTGPYHHGIYGGGGEVGVYAGRFNEKMTEIEAWVRVTDHGLADFFPDLWIKPGVGSYDPPDMEKVGFKESGASGERLVVKAALLEMTPVPALSEIAPYTRTLVVYRYKVLDVVSGTFDRSQLLVAHWGIVDSKRTTLRMQVGEQVLLDLEPYVNMGELEGERLVMELSDMQHPLFYDRKVN